MRRHRQELGPLTEMNVTNLLDTAFVLLMAFMIVAPATKHGIELDLPVVEGESMDKKKTLTVVIAEPSSEGTERVYVDDERLTYEGLTKLLIDRKARFPELDILVEVDKSVPAEILLQTVSAIKDSGIENIGLPTLPTADDSKRP